MSDNSKLIEGDIQGLRRGFRWDEFRMGLRVNLQVELQRIEE